MVGRAATILWLEVIVLPSRGTLKSTLMKTRLPSRVRSLTDSLLDRDMTESLCFAIDELLAGGEVEKEEKEV